MEEIQWEEEEVLSMGRVKVDDSGCFVIMINKTRRRRRRRWSGDEEQEEDNAGGKEELGRRRMKFDDTA